MKRLLFTLLCAMLCAGAAVAEDDKDEAKRHFKQGAIFYNEGNYKAAIIEFKASYKSSPNWKVRFHIAAALHAMGRFVEAQEELEAYMKEGGDEIPQAKLTEAHDLLSQIKGVVGSVDIKTDVEGAGVYVNNKLVGKTPLEKPITLDLGHYVVEVKKKGYTEFSDEFDLPGGEKKVLEPKLEKIGGAEPEEEEEVKEQPLPAGEEKEPKTSGRKKLKPAPFYAMVGVTGALAIGVVITGVMTMQTHQDYEGADPVDDWEERNDLIDKGNTLGAVTDALIGVGAAAALTAVILAVFTDFKKKEKKKTAGGSLLDAPDLKLGAGSILFEQRF